MRSVATWAVAASAGFWPLVAASDLAVTSADGSELLEASAEPVRARAVGRAARRRTPHRISSIRCTATFRAQATLFGRRQRPSAARRADGSVGTLEMCAAPTRYVMCSGRRRRRRSAPGPGQRLVQSKSDIDRYKTNFQAFHHEGRSSIAAEACCKLLTRRNPPRLRHFLASSRFSSAAKPRRVAPDVLRSRTSSSPTRVK